MSYGNFGAAILGSHADEREL